MIEKTQERGRTSVGGQKGQLGGVRRDATANQGFLPRHWVVSVGGLTSTANEGNWSANVLVCSVDGSYMRAKIRENQSS